MKEEKYSYKNFINNYNSTTQKAAQKMAFVGLLIFVLFYILDYYLLPTSFIKTLKIRIFVSSLILMFISFSFLKAFKLHWQKLFSVALIVAGIGIIINSIYLDSPIKTLYLQALILIIFYAYSMNHLLVLPAIITGITITAIYIAVSYNSPEVSHKSFIVSLTFQITTNIIGIFNVITKHTLLKKQFKLNIKNNNRALKVTSLNKNLVELNKKLNDMALTDSLTKIPNRRFFDKQLETSIKNSINEATPITLIMIDIDYFKNYNDYYGHVKGDFCLKQFALLIKNSIIDSHGFVARYGGEEFAVLIPNMGYDQGMETARKIKHDIANAKIPHSKSAVSNDLTASFGVASVSKNFYSLTSKKIISYADSCLYKAKQEGRNKISGASL